MVLTKAIFKVKDWITMLRNGVKRVGYAAGLVVQYYSDEL